MTEHNKVTLTEIIKNDPDRIYTFTDIILILKAISSPDFMSLNSALGRLKKEIPAKELPSLEALSSWTRKDMTEHPFIVNLVPIFSHPSSIKHAIVYYPQFKSEVMKYWVNNPFRKKRKRKKKSDSQPT